MMSGKIITLVYQHKRWVVRVRGDSRYTKKFTNYNVALRYNNQLKNQFLQELAYAV